MSWLLDDQDFQNREDYLLYVTWCEKVVEGRKAKKKEDPDYLEAVKKIESIHKEHYDKNLTFGVLQSLCRREEETVKPTTTTWTTSTSVDPQVSNQLQPSSSFPLSTKIGPGEPKRVSGTFIKLGPVSPNLPPQSGPVSPKSNLYTSPNRDL